MLASRGPRLLVCLLVTLRHLVVLLALAFRRHSGDHAVGLRALRAPQAWVSCKKCTAAHTKGASTDLTQDRR
eukprot:8570035-Prorocentrum_lima.AAC.1